jgi:hypothetical protein
MEREELTRRRLARLVERGLLAEADIVRFRKLDERMSDPSRAEHGARISGFHDGKEYQPLLTRIVDGLAAIGEPHAKEKAAVLREEAATMGPGVFLTPWEMTLEYLDRTVGDVRDVERFYEQPGGATA